jgi:hypothetical protein
MSDNGDKTNVSSEQAGTGEIDAAAAPTDEAKRLKVGWRYHVSIVIVALIAMFIVLPC